MHLKEGGRLALLFRSDSGSMWAGRPHSCNGQQLQVGDIGEDQCGRVAHTPMAANSYESSRINVGGSPTLLWRQVADIIEDRLLGLSIEIGEATGLERAEWRFF